MNSNRSTFLRLALLFLALDLTGRAAALQISLTSDTNFLTDFSVSPTMQCDHVSVSITNSDGIAYSNLWVSLGSFTNTSMQLGGGDPGQYPVGILANNHAGAAFFYVQAANDPGNRTYTNQFTVRVYQGLPAIGTLLASSNFPVVVQGTISANANKINSVTFTPTNNPVVGGIVKISVFGDTGGVGSGAILDFTGASWTNWNAGAFQMVACRITVTNGSNPAFNQFLTNALTAVANSHFTGNGNLYESDYWFRAVATTGTNTTPVSAISYIQSGGQTKHTSLGAGQLPSALPATNLTTLNSLVNSAQLYTNQTVTFALVVSNLSAAYSVTLDRFVDTLPAGFVYLSNSSTFGGAPILEPTNVGGVLTWSQGNTYTVPAGASGNFVFQAIVPGVANPTYFTNSCVGYVQNFQIGSNLTNNAPATETVRALIAPIAGNATNTTALENQTLAVSAPGVLANTVEPNGFTLTIISSSQPANGSATVNADGSYTYTPAAFFWGWDSFTFTITNGNSRVSTGTNYVYVNRVNQPPTASPVLLTRALNTSLKISIANILINYTADPDGYARVLMMADIGTNGSTIYTNGGYIFYAPTNNLPESFIYVVTDARAYRPGDTVLMATNWISISVTNALGAPQSISTGGGGPVAVKFAGVPGYGYDVLRSTDLSVWTVVFTTNAPPNGIWIYTDDNPPQPSAFYRTQQH